jgi:hypothetical protein
MPQCTLTQHNNKEKKKGRKEGRREGRKKEKKLITGKSQYRRSIKI